MGIAWVAFRENVDRRLLLGAFAILTGAALLSWQGQASFQWSGFLIAGACLCWGIDNNLTRELSSSDPVQIAMFKGLVAGAMNLTLALWQGALLPSVGTIAAVGVVGFLGYGVSLSLFVLGLRHLGTARTGAYFSLAPFVGALLAIAMLHEPLSVQLIIAGGLMGLGLWLHLAEEHEHEHVHEPIEHEHVTVTTLITSMSTPWPIRPTSRIPIGTGTLLWCTGIPITPICIIGTVIHMLRDRGTFARERAPCRQTKTLFIITYSSAPFPAGSRKFWCAPCTSVPAHRARVNRSRLPTCTSTK
jgi:hypothetical protein